MANTLTNVIPQILSQAMLVLRGLTVMPQLVNSDYGSEASKKGSAIDVPIAPAIAVRDVVPDPNQPSTSGVTPGTVQIPLNQWKEAPFEMTDKDLKEAMDGTVPMCVNSAATAMAEHINGYIFSLYPDVYSYVGTAGTTPFTGSPATTTDATQARKVLNVNKAPLNMRRMVLDPDAMANALELQNFQDASKAANPSVINDGLVGRKLGMDWYEDQQVPTHTAGAVATSWIIKASEVEPIGETTLLTTTGGNAAVFAGDIITIAGDDQTYVVTADASRTGAGDMTIVVSPGLKVATTGSEAITIKATHVVNLVFQRGAFAFASRPLDDIANKIGMDIQSLTMTDPQTGLSMRLEVTRQYKQTLWALDMLFGGKCIRPELVTRLAG